MASIGKSHLRKRGIVQCRYALHAGIKEGGNGVFKPGLQILEAQDQWALRGVGTAGIRDHQIDQC